MASWTLQCKKCCRFFEHSKIGDTLANHFFPSKPQFHPAGAILDCPHCNKKSVYHGADLKFWAKLSHSLPERRKFKRTALKKRASLVVKRWENDERIPCLIVDSSQEGFRMRGTVRLKRGQMVEVILGENPINTEFCNVVWTGKEGSEQIGEAGLQTIAPLSNSQA